MKFKNVSLQSDRLVVVRDEDKISIVDLTSAKVADLKTRVDSVIIHPSKHIIALKSAGNLQVFDLARKVKLTSTLLSSPAEFWAWADDDTIGIVTADAVLHWDISGGPPSKQFDREPPQEAVQIISYRVSQDKSWLLLGGIFSAPGGDSIGGVLQLFSKSRKRSQIFRESHAGCFAQIAARLLGRAGKDISLFCFTNSAGGLKINAVEVGAEKSGSFRSAAALRLDDARDFVVSLVADELHGLIFSVTKMGQMAVVDIETGSTVFSRRVSESTVFVTSPHLATGGIVTVSQDGKVQRFFLDESNLTTSLASSNPVLAARLAARLGQKMDPEVMQRLFSAALARRDFSAAAKLAQDAPDNALRTPETVQCFARLTENAGETAPLLTYFSQLLKTGKLLDFESVQLVKPVLESDSDGALLRVETWLRKDKLTPSEKLGDLLLRYGGDAKLACAVYLRAGCPAKAIECFVRLGQFDKIAAYADQNDLQPDYLKLLLKAYGFDKEKAKDFALDLVSSGLMRIETAVDVAEDEAGDSAVVSLLLAYFRKRGDQADDAELQTKMLKAAFGADPSLAESILDENAVSNYDRAQIARLCEEASLYAKAMENLEDLNGIKRCLKAGIEAGTLSESFVMHFFGEMSSEEALECLGDLIADEATIELALKVAQNYQAQMTPGALIRLFEEAGRPDALFRFLGAIVNTTDDAEIVFKFVQVAAKTDQTQELRRICKTNTVFDPQRVKCFLMESGLEDPRPLISLCDRFDFVEELARFLVSHGLEAFLEAYVQKMRPHAAPEALVALIDEDAPASTVSKLLSGLSPEDIGARLDSVVEVVAERGRLELLLPWLEDAAAGGCALPHLHNALARIYVEKNLNPKHFLATNEFYSPLELAPLLEARNPELAFTALSRAPKTGDEALLRAARAGGLFRDLAALLVERKDEELWVKALGSDDQDRQALIEEVVRVLERSSDPEQLSVAVRAFIAAELPNELIELLERLVLRDPQDRGFAENKNLQNLLILTAIKADPARVRSYLTQLSDYDGPDIAKIAVSDQYQLYEEAFEIFVRFEKDIDALGVLLDKLEAPGRAKEFCEQRDRPELWEKLGEAHLNREEAAEAIGYFIRANRAPHLQEVVGLCVKAKQWEALADYLTMARAVLKSGSADADLLFALAKAGRLDDFKALLEGESHVEPGDVGVRLMRNELYEAAKILYEQTGNFSRLAVCLVNLGSYDAAVGAAEKAANTHTWKVVCYACVDEGEFQLAQYCAARVAAQADQISDLVSHYEQHGFFSQLLSALEQASAAERAHSGIFTTLARLYCKYRPSKLMAHLKAFAGKVNVADVLKTALKYHCWAEAVFLYRHSGQFERAVQVMMEHSPSCFDHKALKNCGSKITRSALLVALVEFYRDEHPLLLSDILNALKGRLDDSRAVALLRKGNLLPLAKDYLQAAQKRNVRAASEALIDLYLQEESLDQLADVVKRSDNFDTRALASRLDGHRSSSFRALAAQLYNKIGLYEKGMAILKADERYEEMVSAISASKNRVRAEEALRFFVEKRKSHYVAMALIECGSLIRPHVTLELGWRYKLNDVVMPFLLQAVGDFQERLERLEMKEKERSEAEKCAYVNVGGKKAGEPMRLMSGKEELMNGANRNNLLD